MKMMRVYYDEQTNEVLFTYNGPPELAPAGASIEVADEILPSLHGLHVVDGELVRVDLTELKRQAKEEINATVGRVRLMFITDLPGQENIYRDKYIEATAYMAEDPEPATLVDYPFLSKETGVTAPTAYELCQVWLNMGTAWRGVASALEGVRMIYSGATDASTHEAEIEIEMNAFRAEIEALLP